MAKTSWHFLLPVALSLDTEYTVYFNGLATLDVNVIKTSFKHRLTDSPLSSRIKGVRLYSKVLTTWVQGICTVPAKPF